MASTIPQQVIDQITATDNVMDSAILLIGGFGAAIEKAKAEALANGATAEELLPITNALIDIKVKTDALAAAVVANTPVVPPTPAPEPTPEPLPI